MTARLPKRTRVVVEILNGAAVVTADRPIDLIEINFDTHGMTEGVVHVPHMNALATVSDGVTVNRKLVGEIFRSLKGGVA